MNKLLAFAGVAVAGASVVATVSHSAPVAARATALVSPQGNVDGVLRRYDLSPVLRTLPAEPTSYVETMNGFFGADRYRIELVTTRVQRDPQQPGRYQVWGKNRFKGRVTPFTGTLFFTKAAVGTGPSSDWDASNVPVYTATGTYELREDPTRPGAGTFKGTIAADFTAKASGEISEYYGDKDLTKGAGVLYDGTWTSAAGETKPAVWVANIWSYHGPQVFQNFIVGERSQHFNAKYAKLGWNNYWSNDEWWAGESPTVAKRK